MLLLESSKSSFSFSSLRSSRIQWQAKGESKSKIRTGEWDGEVELGEVLHLELFLSFRKLNVENGISVSTKDLEAVDAFKVRIYACSFMDESTSRKSESASSMAARNRWDQRMVLRESAPFLSVFHPAMTDCVSDCRWKS